MTALVPDALAGLEIGSTDESASRALAGGLTAVGARIMSADAAVDLLLVPVDGRPRAMETADLTSDAPAVSVDAAADGTLAATLVATFSAARDGSARLRPGGCLLFVLSPADATARAAVASLTRTLALEWAPDLRVNAIVPADPTHAVDLAALAAWRPSRTLTGAVLGGV